MHSIPVPVESVQLGVDILMKLQYGAAYEIQQRSRGQPGRMHPGIGAQRPDDENHSSNAQQANGGPKRYARFNHALFMYWPGDLVESSQALHDFVLRADPLDHAGIVAPRP